MEQAALLLRGPQYNTSFRQITYPMARIVLFNKPFQVLSQFTDDQGRSTLADYLKRPGFYPAGRLDYDSEGLLLLTDEGALKHRIAHPKHKLRKRYWVQVEGAQDAGAVQQLLRGITLKDGPARALSAERIETPDIWQRTPPIRQRKHQATHWLSLEIDEGRNRQVRRMTAAVGLPTLRLIRAAIGPWALDRLQPGQWREETVNLPRASADRRPRRRV